MSTKFDEYQFDIATDFITAIEYGDYSGLEQEDITALTGFLDSLPHGLHTWHYDSEEYFDECDICGLGATCCRATLTVWRKENK